MIANVRVDHRLVHGQVSFAWSRVLKLNLILIPSDTLLKNQMRINMLRIAKPADVKLIIKSIDECAEAINEGLTDKYRMLILCETIQDMYNLVNQVPEIHSVTLGGISKKEDSRQISEAVSITSKEEKMLRDLIEKGVDVQVQMVPDDPARPIKDLL